MDDNSQKGLLPTILGSNTVRYYPALAKYVGGAKTALFLSQLLYWQFNPKMVQKLERKEGWFYISVADMEDQTGLTKHEQESAKRDLLEVGVIEITYKGMSPKTTHFKVNIEILNDLVSHSPEKRMNEHPVSGSLVTGKADEFNTDITETTSDNNLSPIGETPTPDQEIQSPKTKPKRDERLDHPAITVFREVTQRYPLKPTFDLIIRALGENPNKERLKEVYEEWCARGFKPTNVSGLLEWYKTGITKYNGKQLKNGNQLTGMAALQAMISKPEPQGVIIDVEPR
jgi:hypothetical protein